MMGGANHSERRLIVILSEAKNLAPSTKAPLLLPPFASPQHRRSPRVAGPAATE
jgi:hypothetical protein